MNDPEQLYRIYSTWTAQLHRWAVAHLGEHIDCEFFPIDWKFKVYSGYAQAGDIYLFHTVPTVGRPRKERSQTIKLPTPAEDPTQAELDETFRAICLAAARVLRIDLSRGKRLPSGDAER